MPRLDESDRHAMCIMLGLFGADMRDEHLRDASSTIEAITDGTYEDDPGRYGPVDLCTDCAEEMVDVLLEEGEGLPLTEHPDYDDMGYNCYCCGRRLKEATDGDLW